MSNEYMSTGDESVNSVDSMNTDHPDPAEHLRTHDDEVAAADEIDDPNAQAADPESGDTRNQRNP